MPTLDLNDLGYLTTYLIENSAPIHGVRQTADTWVGLLDFHDGVTQQQIDDTVALASAWYTAFSGVGDEIETLQAAADDAMRAMPAWIREWTAAERETYINANTNNLAEVRAVLVGLSNANVALRDLIMAHVVKGQ